MNHRTTLLFLLLGAGLVLAAGPARADGCVECHQNADFRVTNKKLYDYFQDWRISVHGQEDVTCVDCHGGNAKAKDKAGAHGQDMTSKSSGSAVNFRNIPKTCGTCHSDLYEAYTKSGHFKHLVQKKQEAQGPNCVTCHGSLNATALNVNTVRDTCVQCHNEKTGNHAEIPGKAEFLLNDLNAIRGYARYIKIRGTPQRVAEASKVLDPKLGGLAAIWHGFDLKRIEAETATLLTYTKQQRDAVRADRKGADAKDEDKP